MSEYQNFLILSHLSETIDVPAWFTPLPDQAPSRPGTPQDQAPPPRDQAPPPGALPHHPWEQTPPLEQAPLQQTATVVDGTHSTGMHSC